MKTVNKVVRKIKSGFFKEMRIELKWIFKLADKYKLSIVTYCIISIISMLISLSFAYKSKDLVDMLISKDWNVVIAIGIYYMTIGSINVALSMIIQRLATWVAGRVKKEISVQVYEKILGSNWEMVTKHHTGDLMARMGEDIGNVSGSVVGWIPTIFIQSIQLVISLFIILYYDFSILVVILLVAPIIILGSRIFLGKVYEENKKQRLVSTELTTFEKESFQNLQTIKAFNLKNFFQKNMISLQEKRYQTDLNANKYSIASWSVMYVSGQLAALVCFSWAIYHVYKGYISLGTMTLMIIFASMISSSFKSLISIIPGVMSTITSSTRIRGLLDLEQEDIIDEEKSERILQKGKENGITVKLENVSFSYVNNKKIFNKVSIAAFPGEIVALVGPSGEGKTTMLRLLLGIIKPQEGKAFLSVGDRAEDSIMISQSIRKMISYVPQGNTMMNGTIADNMRMVHPDTTEEEIIDALELSCALEFVGKLEDGIYHNIGESGIGFSEGQNQRLAIARALLCKTPILLLDEATSALDVATERKVLQNIMRKDNNRTCILTTHRPTVLSMCSKVYRIANMEINEIDGEEIKYLMNEF